MKKEHQIHFWYVVVAMIGVMLLQSYLSQLQRIEVIPYSEFRTLLEGGKISEVVVGDTTLHGKLAEPKDPQKSEFVTNKVNPEFADYLARYNVRYSAQSDSTWLTTLLSWVLPALIFVGIWMFAIRRMAGGMGGGAGLLAIGKSKARVYLEKQTGVTFADVAGVD